MFSTTVRSHSVLLPMLFVVAPVQAQLVYSYGIRLGANSSTLTAEITDFERRTGFQGAVFAELLFTPALSVVAEAEYARRGFVSEMEERNANNEPLGVVRAKTGLDYLSIPVMARVRYPGTLSVTPYAMVGPRLDFLIGRNPGIFEWSNFPKSEDELGKNLDDVSLSASVGGGAALRGVLGGEVRVEARYIFGLSDLLPEGDGLDIRSNWLDISVGVTP